MGNTGRRSNHLPRTHLDATDAIHRPHLLVGRHGTQSGGTIMSQAKTFAEKLSALRAEQKMGVRELGRAVGVTGMHISNLEKGKSAPSVELVLKLAEALEANADELLYLADQVSPEVVDVIHQNPLAIPNFLRSAKNLTPEQWELLQKQVEQMTEEK